MNDTEMDDKQRNIEIARNESARQTRGDIRVSTAAIVIAVLIGLAAVGWWLMRS